MHLTLAELHAPGPLLTRCCKTCRASLRVQMIHLWLELGAVSCRRKPRRIPAPAGAAAGAGAAARALPRRSCI